jgi:hypothetical protein
VPVISPLKGMKNWNATFQKLLDQPESELVGEPGCLR